MDLLNIINNLKIGDWISILQTLILSVTLMYLAIQTNQQSRSTRLLITPNLGAKWDIKNGGTSEKPDSVIWKLLTTNYSEFPLYVRGVKFGFPKGKGFPQGYLKGAWHIAPKTTEDLAVFGMSQADWSKHEGMYNWPVTISVSISIGEKWNIRFLSMGPGELKFDSIKRLGILDLGLSLLQATFMRSFGKTPKTI